MVISSWSGGKDSCLAYYKAIKAGYKIKHLLNFVSRESGRCCFHGIEKDLIKLQAEMVGIPLTQKEVTADMQEYEKEFKAAVSGFKDIEAMVFGDIYLLDQMNWVERVCKEIGIRPIEPLWGIPTEEIVRDFIALGFKAIVVSCQAKLFGKEFIGRLIDNDFLNELKKQNICPCGENGEFHTLVIDGVIFKKRIEIEESETELKKGFWEYYFLNIKRYRAIEKGDAVSQIGKGSEGAIPAAAPQR